MHTGNDSVRFATGSPAETMDLGERIGRLLGPGDLVILRGDLGSGKTVFVRGICRAFGCEEQVRSPSFVLVREYEGRKPIFHIDLYRLTGPGDWNNLGVEDRMDQGVALVEWGEKIESIFRGDALSVEFGPGPGETDRVIRIVWNDLRLSGVKQLE